MTLTMDELFNGFREQFARAKYVAGLLLAFIDLVDAAGAPGGWVDAQAFLAERRVEGTNQLVVHDQDGRNVSLRSIYDRWQKKLRNEEGRGGYPSGAPHAVGSWEQYRHWLDTMLRISPEDRKALRDKVHAYVLAELPIAPPSQKHGLPLPDATVTPSRSDASTPAALAQLIAVTLERFKSYESETRIELAPLTVLLGRNNGGKSSIIQSLLLLKQTLADPRPEVLPERLGEPLAFGAGTRVFVVSMGDLFHADVPFEFIAAVWGVMAATPTVTYQVLTKRPERIADFFRYLDTQRWRGCEDESVSPVDVCIVAAIEALDEQGIDLPLPAKIPAWPLPNVWLGTSVEDQQRADERIPQLLAAPAAVRFLSVEPLLGPVDLGRWIGDYDCHHCGARFWNDELHIHGLVAVNSEPDPDRAAPASELDQSDEETRQVCPRCGRADLGTGDVGPASSGDYEGQPTLDWVIVGGESGPGARPMGPAWVRSLRDQCRAAKLLDEGREVAFFFKQWGGVQKAKNGRELDGRTHDAMPAGDAA